MASTPAYWTNKKCRPSVQAVSQLSRSQAPRGFGSPYRGFPAFLAPSNHREECLLFSGHLLPVCRSVIITRYAEKEPQWLVAVDAQRCSLIWWRRQTWQWTQRAIVSLLSHKIAHMRIFYNQKWMALKICCIWSRVADCNIMISENGCEYDFGSPRG